MNRTIVKTAKAYKVEIFIGGDYEDAIFYCNGFCDANPVCVTVEPVTYVYTGGDCPGVRIGLINYARFPNEQGTIFATAVKLADYLKTELKQGSYTVQDHEHSMFVSDRDEDQ